MNRVSSQIKGQKSYLVDFFKTVTRNASDNFLLWKRGGDYQTDCARGAIFQKDIYGKYSGVNEAC
jgi:hypothetical protein